MKKLLNPMRILVILSLVLVCALNQSVVIAAEFELNTNDIKALNYKHAYYEPETCEVVTPTNVSGSDNIEKSYRFLVQKGLKPIQSAGFVGNLKAESGVNPSRQEVKPISGRGGYGIAQWTGGRRVALENAAKAKGVDISDLAFQLDFLWNELETSYKKSVLEPLKLTATIDDATILVTKKFEAPLEKYERLPMRIGFAKEILQAYEDSSTVTPAAIAGSQGCPDAAGSGQNTRFVDGFTIYSQIDPAWKDRPYGTSTIGLSGCGPVAMAMIITALSGTALAPPEAADYAASQGMYINGVGSSWEVAPLMAKRWGLKAAPIGASLANIASTLQSGGLVVASGRGAEPFTKEGHYIVIRGITDEGKFKIGDSYHKDANDKEWDPMQLLASMAGGSVYAITK